MSILITNEERSAILMLGQRLGGNSGRLAASKILDELSAGPKLTNMERIRQEQKRMEERRKIFDDMIPVPTVKDILRCLEAVEICKDDLDAIVEMANSRCPQMASVKPRIVTPRVVEGGFYLGSPSRLPTASANPIPTFDTAQERDAYSQWSEALDYCKAVAREIGEARNEKSWCYSPKKYIQSKEAQGWRSLNSGVSYELFAFESKEKCDLFIESVEQWRLDLIFGVKR